MEKENPPIDPSEYDEYRGFNEILDELDYEEQLSLFEYFRLANDGLKKLVRGK